MGRWEVPKGREPLIGDRQVGGGLLLGLLRIQTLTKQFIGFPSLYSEEVSD